MTEMEIQAILKQQREYFAAGHTLSAQSRLTALKKLKAALQNHEADLAAALKQDLGKSATESYMCETGLTMSEASWMIRHLRRLMRERTVPTPLSQFVARSFRSPSPYGNVLIMSPWNYPVLLTLDPLIDAIAAGNTAIVKPSAYAPPPLRCSNRFWRNASRQNTSVLSPAAGPKTRPCCARSLT